MDSKKLQMLLNASLNSQKDIIILAIDCEFNYYLFNDTHAQAMKDYYGVSVQVGMNLLDAITSKEDRIKAKQNYDRAISGQSHVTIQSFGDVQVHIFETFYNPLYDEHHHIVGATAYARNITDRIQAEEKLRISEEEHRLMYEAVNQGIALHEIIWDESGMPIDYVYLRVNDFYEIMTGLKRENIIGRRVSDVLPLTESYWWDAFKEVSLSRKPKRVINYSQELKKHYSISFYSPQVNQVAGIVDDVTDLFTIQTQLLESESRFQILAEQSSTMIWEVNREGMFLYVSDVILKLLGYTPNECIQQLSHQDFYPLNQKNQYIKEMQEYLDYPDSKTSIERILLTKTGSEIWVETVISPVYDSYGKIVKYRGSDKDIRERKSREAEIVFMNEHDHLTKLYNRRYFDQALKQNTKKSQLPISLLMFDLNGLKLVNDAFGHEVGDTFIVQTAKALSKRFSALGVVARIGGDEFCVILPRTDATLAKKLGQEVKEQIESITTLGVKHSISFGQAVKTNQTRLVDLLKVAEDDMYAKKLFETTSHRNETIKTILKTLHEKNPREEAHSRRVAYISSEIGKALGMTSEDVQVLRTISHLHDIGKIAIDESILNKPGKLDASEWVMIKKHPEIGYRILSTTSEYDDIAIDILSHHERFDGLGYPRGLKGDAIPLRARIIAIADAFDAMISFRTYRPSLSLDEAKMELLHHKGTQFDPTLVDVFLKLTNQAGWLMN